MKYIKKYEDYNETIEPEIDDYILAEVSDFSEQFKRSEYIINNYLGRFIHKDGSTYEIEYILPEDMYNDYFKNLSFTEDDIWKINNVRYVRMKLVKNDIKYWSKNKEDLELKLNVKKYNL